MAESIAIATLGFAKRSRALRMLAGKQVPYGSEGNRMMITEAM
ncbi:hypothetical protein HMPREF1981_02700 [Bacteroides pyogenes F0041]|uniref:Uncharacterized protein n=1 Tax=Bacteroides pyogenes F0041 TaxID=1321819 RepID=U2CBU4_9BACE|nr:hypothetical protein [Bacteroides pyogenes]ERI82010.1 hypothetical protein HMPREF1981_02700 [Bacteroides pyogenes F0041]